MVEAAEAREYELPKKTFTIEFFVGIFVCAGLACLAYLAVNLAGMALLDTGYYSVYARFDNVSGLEKGSRVEIAGVPVGEVTEIDLQDTLAVVHMNIQNAIKLRDDDIAMIRTKGIIGERYVKISPGGSEELVTGGEEIIDTESVVDFEEIIGKIIHNIE